MEVKVLSCRKNEFTDKAGKLVSGYSCAVSLGDGRGFVEVWSNTELHVGDVAFLEIVEGRFHKPKVKLIG